MWAIDLRDTQTPNHPGNIKDPSFCLRRTIVPPLNTPQLRLDARLRLASSEDRNVRMTHQGRPLDLFGFCSLQLDALLPFGPNQLMLQQKHLEVFVHLHPLTLLPLKVIELHIYLWEERVEGQRSVTETCTCKQHARQPSCMIIREYWHQ